MAELPIIKFDTERFQNLLKTSFVGRQLLYFDVTGSTMDDARRVAVNNEAEYSHGSVLMAERQTKARGARDHKWNASNTGNIYASFILHLPYNYKLFEGKFDLEVAACLAVQRVAVSYGVTQAIPKWPNDVWVNGHKLAGFLTEDGRFEIPGNRSLPGNASFLMILGMGINVNADIRRNSELHSIATSIKCERNGKSVDREAFFADVCLAFEENLSRTHQENLDVFRKLNLFQRGCDISVTCPAEGTVMSGEFLQISDDWEVMFQDKRTGNVVEGRSDRYTIRPKVHQKVLVVFTGAQSNKSAAILSRWMTSLVDTTKYNICLVPAGSLLGGTDWMTNCSLLVLPEDTSELSQALTSRIQTYLKRGGNVMASGIASAIVASILDVPVKEGILESSITNSDVGIVCLDEVLEGDNQILFPSMPVCFQFKREFLQDGAEVRSLQCAGVGRDTNSVRLNNVVDQSVANSSSPSSHLMVTYSRHVEDEYNVAVFTRPTTHGGFVTLWGFDFGVIFPAAISDLDKSHNSENTESMEKEIISVARDTFKRDALLIEAFKALLS